METQSIPWREKVQLIVRFLRGSIHYFVVALLCACLGMVFNALTPQVIRLTVDSILGAEQPSLPAFLQPLLPLLQAQKLHALWLAAAAVLLLALLRGFCNYGQRTQLSRGSESFVKRIRDGLYDHIQHLSFSWHTAHSTGEIIQRCTSDVDVIRTFVCNQLVEVVRTVFLIILYLVIMFRMNVRLSFVALAFIPIVGLSSGVFYRRISGRFQAADEAEGDLTTCAQENLTGVRVVRAFGREEYERQRFEKQNEDYTTLWVRLCRTLSDFWAVGDATACIQTMLVVLIGSILCVRGEMTEGEFVSFTIYNTMSISPVRRLGRVISEMSKAGVSVSRIGEILDAPCEQDKPDAKELPMDGDIVFDHVSFRYETGPDVLSDVSFTIPAGSSFGILGGTGSGKSSLLLMLCRLYAPSEGRVMVGGEDLADMPAAWVRDHVGVVLQEPFLFSRTIEENIGICGADRETVRSAAATACIASDIEQFANGYDTMVGERGVTLSGGQKQRVAIARMLTKKTPVMVFDDSLSAVDTQTDEHIREALNRDLAGTTTIIISHRITTLMDCDNILVLEHGKVLQRGTPQELLRQPGLFRQIYDMQMSIGEEEPA